MKITIELTQKFVIEYREGNDDDVILEAVYRPGHTVNQLPDMSNSEVMDAVEALNDAHVSRLTAELERLIEKRQIRMGTYRSPRTGE